MTFKERFWRRLHSLSLQKIKENHGIMGFCDMKCPHCNQWASLVGITLLSWNDKQDRYECKNCRRVTAWHMDAPVPFIVPIKYFNEYEVEESL